MRINIPVITRCGPPIRITKDGAECVNSQGNASWAYKGTEVTGKGIFVAACARSGTMYMTKVLSRLGYKIGHEMSDADGSVGYHLAVIKPKNCFHQVRHPLKQISSMFDHQSWGFMNQVIECHGKGLLGCMQYWLKWNELLEEFCVWRYQLEKIQEVWPEFLERVGHSFEPLPDVPTDTNSKEMSLSCSGREFHSFGWDDLFKCERPLAKKILEKAEYYGYEVPEMGKTEYHSTLGQLVTAQVASV